MNNNGKLFLILLLTGLVLGGGWFFWDKKQSLPKEHQAIKIFLKQSQENQLALENIKLYQTFPSKPYLNKNWERYYQIKIVNQKGQTLYLTQVPKKYLISRFTYPGYETVGVLEKLNTDIDLFLPVYPVAKQVIVQDEQNNTLMTINLANVQ